MCEHDAALCAPVAPEVSRRGLLAGAALAGAGLSGLASPAHARAADAAASSDGFRVRPPTPPPLVLEGGTLLDPATGRVTVDSVVVLAGGRVLAAGTRAATADARHRVGNAARRLDLSGTWVLPGLVDVHVHVNALADAVGVLANGATSARSGSSLFYQDVGVRALARWAPGTVPRLRAAGIFVTPDLGDTVLADPALAPLATQPDGVRSLPALRHLTRVNLDRGADVIKTRTNERAGLPEQDPLEEVYDFRQVQAIVEEAREDGKPVLSHSYSVRGCDNAVRAGVASLEHGVFVSEATLARMRRRGTFFTPTMAAIAGLAESPDPILAERGRTFLPVLRQAVRAAHEMGVRVVAGTDTFGAATRPIAAEVALIASAGLPALDAIRAATTRAARLLRMHRAGRLFPGAFADVVAVDGSPLDDITALGRIRLVVAGGAVARDELPD